MNNERTFNEMETSEDLNLIVIIVDGEIGRQSFNRYFRADDTFEGLQGIFIQKTTDLRWMYCFFTYSREEFPALYELKIEPGVVVKVWRIRSDHLQYFYTSIGCPVKGIATPAPTWLLEQMQKQALYIESLAQNDYQSEEREEEKGICETSEGDYR